MGEQIWIEKSTYSDSTQFEVYTGMEDCSIFYSFEEAFCFYTQKLAHNRCSHEYIRDGYCRDCGMKNASRKGAFVCDAYDPLR